MQIIQSLHFRCHNRRHRHDHVPLRSQAHRTVEPSLHPSPKFRGNATCRPPLFRSPTRNFRLRRAFCFCQCCTVLAFSTDKSRQQAYAVLRPEKSRKEVIIRHNHLSTKFFCNPFHILVIFTFVEGASGIYQDSVLCQCRPDICYNPALTRLT